MADQPTVSLAIEVANSVIRFGARFLKGSNRMSDLLMASPVEDWPGLLARIEREKDVIVPFDGIPGRMSEEAFEARFVDVESVAYLKMLDKIEAKIDLIALHR